MSLQRGFNAWAVRCDIRLSTNKRLCALQQFVGRDNHLVLWRISQTATGKLFVVVSVGPDFDNRKPMTISFKSVDKRIEPNDWTCGKTGCIAGFEFTPVIQTAISSSSQVKFSYFVKDQAGQQAPVSIDGSMDGFNEAIAAATNPFARFDSKGKPVKGEEHQKAEVKEPHKPARKEARVERSMPKIPLN
nr:invasion associated locus B family protein [Allorhizobium sonneratiae]